MRYLGEMEPESKENPQESSIEDQLQELAKKELLREIKCASLRAEQFGAHSWAKPQHYVPSKRFLRHMLISASKTNDRREQHNLEKRKKAMKHNSDSASRNTFHTKHSNKKRDKEENGTHNSKKHKHTHKKEDLPVKERKKHKEKDVIKSTRKKHHREK
ncbi:uncharacterized protein TNIN_284001 [Trichonephila inaurata madagascariensis]|uniref:Uncharacterized protein n=1 Tax=Trichonephila inaurata madagascariensis TaxID=2747483 RepID=A0A8X6WTM0_9ARAC|nr:uncharacterized protein TNIN_431451 [Trichonephila inaurata madagascariensis]GFY57942.1 uncharacterized protein TNIN_284001 [Trichonephila inaurata madagascariensis]